MNEVTENERHAGPKFSVGRLVATPGALANVMHDEILQALKRHVNGDWGEVCDEDQAANEEALVTGTRLLSAYTSQSGTKFWIITEADRSATTILLPEEY
jgi:hypothetical protein